MRRLGLRRAALVSVVVIAAMLGTGMPSAHALGGGAGALQGSGTITPGLTTTAQTQNWTMAGTIAGTLVAGTSPGAGLYNLTFSGSSTGPETIASGTVSGSANIAGSGASGTCTVTITRVGIWTVMQLRCHVTVTTPFGTVTADICLYVAGAAVLTAVLPWNVYAFVGLIVGGCA